MKVVVFIGPPGCGKGTISQKCKVLFGWEHVSFGNLLREEIAAGTALGKRIDAIISKGNLMDDETIIALIYKVLRSYQQNQDAPEGIILDGVPRTVVQAEALYNFFITQRDEQEQELLIVNMSISDDAVLDRLTSRLMCKNASCQKVYSLNDKQLSPKAVGKCDACNEELVTRPDDTVGHITHRLQLYREHEELLLRYFKMIHFPVQLLRADQSLDAVFKDFEQIAVETKGQQSHSQDTENTTTLNKGHSST